jgi:predicted GNAT superfamily acetyltransferase
VSQDLQSVDGFVIRDLQSLDDYAACVSLQEETWGTDFAERVPPAILRVSQYVGGVAAGAFDTSDRMAGFVFGMTGVRNGHLVHWSDMLAVREPYRGRHLGAALKTYQRHKVVAAGVQQMLWTYDPLVARNANLNINRLGARPVEYMIDMYGTTTGSAMFGMLPTDRFIVSWDLTRDQSPVSAAAAAARPGDDQLPLANPLGASGTPAVNPLATMMGSVPVRVQIPRDIQEEQRLGGDRALRWRLAVREAAVSLLLHGYRVERFVPRDEGDLPYYVFSPAGVA